MNEINSSSFTEEVSQKLGNYVYRLIDPRNGETFYVGKGQGNRVFQHALGALKLEDTEEDELSVKNKRILDIKNHGLEVIHVIHRHEIPEHAILHVEAALIDAYSGLSNEQSGHGSSSYGPMHVNQIIEKYSLPSIDWEPEEKLILININNIQNRSNVDEIYKQVKGNWRISINRAQKADYVIAARRGVAIGIFTIDNWLISTEHEGRYCFEGHPAPKEIWDKFVGTRGKRIIHDNMKHIQYPIRYWNC
jgi:uncharacterized protein